MNVEAMGRLKNVSEHSAGNGRFPAVFTVVVEGTSIDREVWLCSTSETAVAARRADAGANEGALPEALDVSASATVSGYLAGAIAVETRRRVEDIASFIAWLGDPEWALSGPCTACGGTGEDASRRCKRCEGDGEIDCECTCGDAHERNCPDCDGQGDGECAATACDGGFLEPDQRLGVLQSSEFREINFDRRLIARAFDAAAVVSGACDVLVPTDHLSQPIIFVGDDWRVVVMACRASMDAKERWTLASPGGPK